MEKVAHSLRSRIVAQALNVVDYIDFIVGPGRFLKRYFLLRDDILALMPYTTTTLSLLINPYLPARKLPGMGYVSAIIQTQFFMLLIHRQARQGGNDHIFSIAPLFFPWQTFPFGVAEAAVLELHGVEAPTARRYDSLADVDLTLQTITPLLQKHLSSDHFAATKSVIERILGHGMREAKKSR